jgi:hypothetical protein
MAPAYFASDKAARAYATYGNAALAFAHLRRRLTNPRTLNVLKINRQLRLTFSTYLRA